MIEKNEPARALNKLDLLGMIVDKVLNRKILMVGSKQPTQKKIQKRKHCAKFYIFSKS